MESFLNLIRKAKNLILHNLIYSHFKKAKRKNELQFKKLYMERCEIFENS